MRAFPRAEVGGSPEPGTWGPAEGPESDFLLGGGERAEGMRSPASTGFEDQPVGGAGSEWLGGGARAHVLHSGGGAAVEEGSCGGAAAGKLPEDAGLGAIRGHVLHAQGGEHVGVVETEGHIGGAAGALINLAPIGQAHPAGLGGGVEFVGFDGHDGGSAGGGVGDADGLGIPSEIGFENAGADLGGDLDRFRSKPFREERGIGQPEEQEGAEQAEDSVAWSHGAGRGQGWGIGRLRSSGETAQRLTGLKLRP